VAVSAELLGAAWEALTLGELLVGTGLLGAGAGSLALGRVFVGVARAAVKALGAWASYLEASTEAARAAVALAPLKAEALRLQIRRDGGEPPSAEPDSDELQVLRVAALGDDDELERLVEQLAHADEGSTLDRKLSRAEKRLVEVLRAARGRRQIRAEGGQRKRKITVVPVD
jgi:hypothetical protein